MANPVAEIGQSHQHHPVTASAFQEAQKWIEAVTGRCFGDKNFRGGLENGILLCELLSSIKPGSVKKINRLATPIAGLDNLSVFLRGCEELGLKGSQLFDPGDLQDTTTRPTAKGGDCSRKLKNVLITIYWLGRAANGCTTYNGPTLDLREFEGLLSQMRKEAEVAESPQRSIRDSGYIDCWDSERSDSLSPPRHGREDSFDSLDSFGSRSQQTPSPDVLVARGSSDGRGSDSESDGPPRRKTPDIHKDDMLARRTSVSEPRTAMPFNQYLPNKCNQSGYVPMPLRKKKSDKEEGDRKSWSTATSPVGGDRPLRSSSRSCSEELFHQATSPVNTCSHSPPEEAASPAEDAVTRLIADRTPTSPRGISFPCPLLPVPAANTGRRKGRAPSERNEAFSDRDFPATVSGDPQSVSMIDMRAEEDAVLQPHSQVRHELMHNQYNRMKEEDSHWQDDLARWKSRRRSISQDLIKKEEERKLMEQLLSGDTCISHRRKSIKTYREIVEDKERREEELRAAYRRARTPEEASFILQRYAQRFSISEAVLERLQLPKLLDRSISADPSFPCFPISLSPSPTTPAPSDTDPNGPMKYLRQQSAPAPRFMSTLEARVDEFPRDSPHRPQIRARSSEPPSNRVLPPKPVPLLTPKPYLQSWPSTPEPWSSKPDGLLRVNGKTEGDPDAPIMPESPGREFCPVFLPSSPKTASPSTCDAPSPAHSSTAYAGSPVSTHASAKASSDADVSLRDIQYDKVTRHSTPASRPTSLPAELQKPEGSFGMRGSQSAAAPVEEKCEESCHQTPAEAKQEAVPSCQSISSGDQSGVGTQATTSQTSMHSHLERNHHKNEEVASSAAPGTTAGYANTLQSPLTSSNPNLRWEFFADKGEKDHCSNEKYQREQEKLKEEWEKAQREVAEEERRYHEEERRILEETVAPLTPSPGRTEPSPDFHEPQDAIVRSLADWERKQERLHSKGSAESTEWRRRENDRTSDISTADDSFKTGRSSVSQSSCLQNGQKLPQIPKTSSPGKKQQELAADTKRPAGERRSVPTGNNVGHSSSKSPAACPPPGDTMPPPNRSVSGKKLCSSCSQPLGKGAAMIIETLSLFFHIDCFKCGVCKGQLGDTSTGTDVRIRNGLLNCHQCYIRSRSAGQPTTL
ncbi:LIM and calponin homology domains-containing protein 1 isoform X2 [Dunckerocampus dactyliophorus]|uniref:LIM and calponin homology domains-containing protein 1 isoform X2 n=1 Tax=Dunckerocampus dactyliophorus TaxID=161453 RepID=UPI00240743D4|nr:LIM and calponin homology domains-containing protein 1 isoform X2 [Dunckerocampus dactyliophorus]